MVRVMHSVCRHFGLEDSTQITWAHAVNTQKDLEAAANDPTLHVVECDVHDAGEDSFPCIAHAWQDIADCDVLQAVTTLSAAGKAVKLDFAMPQAVVPTLELLQRLKLPTPIILHANIFSLLHVDDEADAMEPEQFVRLCQQYCPDAVLSLGWSLKREHDSDGRVEDVLIHQVADLMMKRLGPVNYALEIRAGYTPGWERGAALLFDPLPTAPTPAVDYGSNVVNAAGRFRPAA